MTTLLWSLFVLFAILQVLDIITTIKAIDSGKGAEANPIIKAVMNKIGTAPALLISKAVIVGGMASAVYFFPSTALIVSLGVVICLYGWVIWNNWKLVKWTF